MWECVYPFISLAGAEKTTNFLLKLPGVLEARDSSGTPHLAVCLGPQKHVRPKSEAADRRGLGVESFPRGFAGPQQRKGIHQFTNSPTIILEQKKTFLKELFRFPGGSLKENGLEAAAGPGARARQLCGGRFTGPGVAQRRGSGPGG